MQGHPLLLLSQSQPGGGAGREGGRERGKEGGRKDHAYKVERTLDFTQAKANLHSYPLMIE